MPNFTARQYFVIVIIIIAIILTGAIYWTLQPPPAIRKRNREVKLLKLKHEVAQIDTKIRKEVYNQILIERHIQQLKADTSKCYVLPSLYP